MEFNEIQKVWHQQSEHLLPESSAIHDKIRMQKQLISSTILRTVIQLCVTMLLVIIIGMSINFESPLSYIGIVIMVLCIAIYSYINYRHYQNITSDYSTLPAKEYLTVMQRNYEIRKRFAVQGTLVYIMVLTLGLLFYLIEPLQVMTTFWKVASLLLTIGWILFAYLYLGRRTIARENARFEEIIRHLKNLQLGFND